MQNEQIRKEIASSGLYHWQVAQELHISEGTFCKWLRTELPEEKQNQILSAIKSLKGVK